MANNDYTGIGKASKIHGNVESSERVGRVTEVAYVDNASLLIAYSADDTLQVATIPAGGVFIHATVQIGTACNSNIKGLLGATALHTASKATNTILADAAGNTYTQCTADTAVYIHNAGANLTGTFTVIIEYFKPLN